MMCSPERLLEQAIALAVKCHSGQSRKYTVRGCRLPYVVHPIEVMKTVWAWAQAIPSYWPLPFSTMFWRTRR